MRRVLIAMAACLAAAPVLANVEVAPRTALLVLVRNDASPSLSEPMLRRVLVVARDLWRPHAEVTFTGTNDVRRYTRPSLDLVLTERTLSGRENDNGLGWIEFVNGKASRTVTISVVAARGMMKVTKWSGRPMEAQPAQVQELFLTRALGRAVAHEVGHYLLNSKAHPPTGLMREQMTIGDIMLNQRPRDLFDAGELARLRGRLEELARDVATGDGGNSGSS